MTISTNFQYAMIETNNNYFNFSLLTALKLFIIFCIVNIMDTYSVQEKIQCLKWYFSGNSMRQIRDLCSALYPNQLIPSISSIHGLIKKFNETGSVVTLCKKCKNFDNQNQENEVNEERNENKLNVLLRVTENPNLSVRQISSQVNLHRATVHKILKSEKFYSYKYSKHQEIFEVDKMARNEFCELIMEKSNTDRHFLKNICFTDESTFTLHGEPNNQNFRYWSKDNPHVMLNTHTQYPQKINVWAGIFGSHIIGPFFIEGSLNSEKYLNLLENDIGPELEIHSNQDSIIWYQHDGCPAHYSQEVKVHLDQCFPESWIGRGGSINWPARSPDLTPCDFFLWPYLKEKIYSHQNEDIASLKNAIVEECNSITQRQLSAVRRNFYDRLGHCLAVNGDLFEHLL